MSKDSEKRLEARLVREVKARGGLCIKLNTQFYRGLPDRLVLMPCGSASFVEVKTAGEKPRPSQLAAHAEIRRRQFPVRVVDSSESLDRVLEYLDMEQLLLNG